MAQHQRFDIERLPLGCLPQIADMRLYRVDRGAGGAAESVVHPDQVIERIRREAEDQHIVGLAHMTVIIDPIWTDGRSVETQRLKTVIHFWAFMLATRPR